MPHKSLNITDLHVVFGSKHVVNGVTLGVNAGERVGLVGPSGAGKSTIVNAIAGLVVPTSGTIELFGESRESGSRTAKRKRACRVGVVHQQLLLTSRLRVVHNVNAGRLGQWSLATSLRSLVKPVASEDVVSVLSRVGIGDKLLERTDSLSGGQQQRVALARVLLQGPDLFLADEPVSAVDPAWSERVLEELSHEVLTRSSGLLVVLHDVALAQKYCDRLIGIRDGAVAFDKPTSDVSVSELNELYLLDSVHDFVRN